MSSAFALRIALFFCCFWAASAPAAMFAGVAAGESVRSPASAVTRVAANQAPPAAARADPADAKGRVWDMVLKNGRRVSEPAVLQVHQGDDVTLRVTSNTPDELHLHGYNLRLQVAPETTATLRFNAKLTGRFPIESHKTEASLGAVEVYPQ